MMVRTIAYLSGLLLSLFMLSAASANTAPVTITFSDNETVSASLSSVDMNRLVVRDDRIKNIQCPTGFCTIDARPSDKSGAIFVSLNMMTPFTFYVRTESGRNFGVFVSLSLIHI